jgi:soluble lytic murein transglycosylase-like protein
MHTAAPQHSARLEGVQTQLSRILFQPEDARHPGERARPENGRLKMNTTFLIAVRAYAALRSTLALVGAFVLAALLMLPGPRQTLLDQLPDLPGTFATETAIAAGAIQVPGMETALDREKQALTEYIARRYRVSEDAVSAYVATAYYAGSLHSVDPILVLAVMAIESRYNPVAESVMGAKGLMQVIPKFHPEKLSGHGGDQALLNPEVNILVGTQILREYYRRLGDLESSLQMYAGALDDPTSQYAAKVLAERARLEFLRQKARKPQSA